MEVPSNKTQWPWSTAGKALAAAVVLAIPAVCLSPVNLRLNDLASPPPATMVLPVTVAVDDAAAPAVPSPAIAAPSVAPPPAAIATADAVLAPAVTPSAAAPSAAGTPAATPLLLAENNAVTTRSESAAFRSQGPVAVDGAPPVL